MCACVSVMQLVTSAHYLLSDLYVSNQMDGYEINERSNEDSDDQNEQVNDTICYLT